MGLSLVGARAASALDIRQQTTDLREHACAQESAALGIRQTCPQELDDQPVRDRALRGVGTRGDDRAAERLDFGGGRLGKAGLADSCFTHEHDDPPICRSGGVRPGDGLHESVAADHRESRLMGGHDRGRCWLNRRRRHSVSDRFVPSSGLGQRRHSQLAIERRHAGAVLAQGAGAVTACSEDIHQSNVGALVERVELDALRSRSTSSDEISGGFRSETQPIEDGGNSPFDRHRPGGSPIVELRAVAQPEAREKGAAGQRRRRGQLAEAQGSGSALEIAEVDANPRLVQTHLGCGR